MLVIDIVETKIQSQIIISNYETLYNDYIIKFRKNKDVFNKIKYLQAPGINFRNLPDKLFCYVLIDRKIIGCSGIEVNPDKINMIWITFVSVDPKYTGRGFARKMIEEIYKYAVENNLVVKPSSFTEDGQRLKHIFVDMNKKYPKADCHLEFKDF